ncbi:uncharacterized protein BDV14DRAFT_195875 [Aspergillus stella-maris]|uniref:uncharacterized protein n=1 Tax=Aspergillus stella-maris TaxID=1810926 RepID=UPI003CCDF4D5
MKFTGIIASLAIASTAAAAAVPILDLTQVQTTVTHLDGVISDVESAIAGGSIVKDLSVVSNELSGIHDLLNGLVGSVVGAVDSNELLQGVLDTIGGVVTTVVNTIGFNDQVPDFGILSEKLVSGIRSGEVDEAGLQDLLTVVGGTTGLANLNKLLSQSQ